MSKFQVEIIDIQGETVSNKQIKPAQNNKFKELDKNQCLSLGIAQI